MLIRLVPFLLSVMFLSSFVEPPSQRTIDAQAYIEKYKDFAILEMELSGIPASITLAQGLHESNFGKSRLAVKANNHFGIKCKKEWTGKKIGHKDDDYKDGKLIKSCFRVYENPYQSYRDHSNFLVYRERYSALFKLDKFDYKGWANGLKKAGYATDKKYPKKLIGLIEEFDLTEYDTWTVPRRIRLID